MIETEGEVDKNHQGENVDLFISLSLSGVTPYGPGLSGTLWYSDLSTRNFLRQIPLGNDFAAFYPRCITTNIIDLVTQLNNRN